VCSCGRSSGHPGSESDKSEPPPVSRSSKGSGNSDTNNLGDKTMRITRGVVPFAVIPLAIAVQAALAQQATAPASAASAASAPAAEVKSEETEAAQRIIVTGVGKKTLKKDATFTINVLTDAEIRRLAPISTADLLQNVPGIFAEGSTAGEASNNITVRGLPVTGGYRYAPQLIDGLPWFEEPEVQFMNNDVAVRDDLMTKRVEVIKGGTGGILYSNGLGATINHITRTGSQIFEGGYKVEVADYKFLRNDFFVSGPLSKNLTFALGGFYRTSNGIRDTGYTADQGGQVRGNLVYTTDDGRTEVQLHGLKINDRTAFFQNVPFQVPGFSQPGTPANPIRVDMNAAWPIGIDFKHGTVGSPYNRVSTMLGEYGQRKIDMADGIHPDFGIYTFKLKHEFDSGWTFDGGVRSTGGTSGFTAMFTGNDAATASRFNNARYQNDVVNPALGQALALANNPAASPYSYAKLAGFFNIPADPAKDFAGISRDQLISKYAKATGVAAFYADSGSKVDDSAYLNFLLPFVTTSEARSTSADFKLSNSFEAVGKHAVTVGGYSTNYSVNQNFQASLLVSTLETQSRLVNLRGVDAAGKAVGPSLTLDGAILPGFFGYVSNATVRGQALYLHDHWDTLDNQLKLDLGVRTQTQQASVVRYDRSRSTDLTPASVVPGSANDTTADNEVSLPGAPRYLNTSLRGTGWSVGGNYSILPNLAVYGLVSKSFRLPSLEDLNEFRIDASVPGSKVEKIMQYETGLRFYADSWDTQVAVFYNKFSPRDNVITFRDFTSSQCTVTGGVPNINSCPEVREFYRRGIQNVGAEVEAAWRPEWVRGLELRGTVVVQDPKIIDANYRTVKEIRVNDVVTGYTFESIGENGRRPRRLAQTMLNLQAVYDTKPLTGLPLKPYTKFTYFGSRYSESTDTNVTLYPAYYHLDGGFIWDFDKNAAFQFHVANITNKLSFTEGDPLFADLKGPNGATNRGVARPLFGRTLRASFTYFF
jgi:outer membrane receptor protein involved in Fe transport